MKNLLSIDLEDWYHFIGDPAAPPYEKWAECSSRVETVTDTLLEIISPRKVTFFVLGFIAQQHPQLIKKIASFGHEIACHGFKHEFVFQIGPQRFREDISRTKKLLEDITGKECKGYRAPGFSIRKEDLWALDIIGEEGFRYDSSIFPAVRTSGGIAGFNPYPQGLKVSSGELMEIPVSTSRVMGITTAFCGGGFFRFFPEWYIHKHIRRINAQGQPAVVYIHPRDIDPGQPRMPLKFFNGFMYYYGLGKARDKFIRLVNAFEWVEFRELCKN